MSDIKRRQQQLLSAFSDPGKVRSVAAAVSGGVDSVTLLLLLAHYCRMKKLQLCVFHVDHALRESSAADRQWVGELAQKLGLDFYWRRADSADCIAGERLGSEAWARRFRYDCFTQMLEESGANIVATGHTADDQAETVVMRLLRGCGVAGASGIRNRRTIKVSGQLIKLWRPLLKITRRELHDYLLAASQDWREDETNSSEIYFRNLVRLRVIPIMTAAAAGAACHLADFAEEMQGLHSLVMRLARNFLRLHKKGNSLEVGRVPSAVLRREVIRLWLIEAELGEAANRRLIGQIDELWCKKGSGRRVICRQKAFCRIGSRVTLTEYNSKS